MDCHAALQDPSVTTHGPGGQQQSHIISGARHAAAITVRAISVLRPWVNMNFVSQRQRQKRGR